MNAGLTLDGSAGNRMRKSVRFLDAAGARLVQVPVQNYGTGFDPLPMQNWPAR